MSRVTRRRMAVPEDAETVVGLEEQTLERLKRLSFITTRPLALLNTEQIDDLESIRKQASELYNTAGYSIFHTEVTKLFGASTSHAPHTVGSYFMGCSTGLTTPPNSEMNAGCALLCAGSLPPLIATGDHKWGFCSQNVIWCLPSNSLRAQQLRENPIGVTLDTSTAGGFDFIFMTRVTESSKAVLFVEYDAYNAFPGFSKLEKARLVQRMHIHNVKLLSAAITDGQHADLIGRAIEVTSLKERSGILPVSSTGAQQQDDAMRGDTAVMKPSVASMPWEQIAFLALVLSFLLILIIGVPYALRKAR